MGARVIAYGTGTFSLFGEVYYTLAQTTEEPLAADQVPVFEGLRDGLKTLLLQEVDFLEQRAKAQATVDRADDKLDRFVSKVLRAVDEHTDGSTRKQLRKKLLKGKSPSKLTRPVLGRQIQDMSDWSQTLSDCGVPALVALAPDAAAHHQAGEAASAARDTVAAAVRNFREVGARKQFIDKLNAERKAAEGALGKLPFQSNTLPQDFADGFFLREPPRDEEETIEDVKASIVALENQLAEEKARLAKLETEAAEAAKAAEAAEAAETEAAALEAQAAALLKKAASLKANK